MKEVRIRPVDDGYTKLFVDGEEIYYGDNYYEIIRKLLDIIECLGVTIKEDEHECTICDQPCDCW